MVIFIMLSQTGQDLGQKELLTVKEVASYLRVGRVTVWRWCQDGVIPAIRIGRNWRIHRSDLRELLETSKHNALDQNEAQADLDVKE